MTISFFDSVTNIHDKVSPRRIEAVFLDAYTKAQPLSFQRLCGGTMSHVTLENDLPSKLKHALPMTKRKNCSSPA